MAIIGISGRAQSGKDTVGKIIQYLTLDLKEFSMSNKDIIADITFGKAYCCNKSNWKIHKFADNLKDIICILTGCSREQVEDNDFKNSLLPEEWIRYGKANGFYSHSDNNPSHKIMDNKQCSKEEYEEELRINWQTTYKYYPTYRQLLQSIGTDLLRNKLHENVWVNSLMNKYIRKGNIALKQRRGGIVYNQNESNWIITDVRFPNEAKAIKDRDGIIIRVERKNMFDSAIKSLSGLTIHESETALDLHKFDYTINNNGTIDDLIQEVKSILIKEKLL